MNIFASLFASRAPTPSDAARVLAERRVQGERELVKARARQLCIEIGKPVPEALQ